MYALVFHRSVLCACSSMKVRGLVVPDPVRQHRRPDHTNPLSAQQQARDVPTFMEDLAHDLRGEVPVMRAAPDRPRMLRSAGEV